jgi:hypothetical protein
MIIIHFVPLLYSGTSLHPLSSWCVNQAFANKMEMGSY